MTNCTVTYWKIDKKQKASKKEGFRSYTCWAQLLSCHTSLTQKYRSPKKRRKWFGAIKVSFDGAWRCGNPALHSNSINHGADEIPELLAVGHRSCVRKIWLRRDYEKKTRTEKLTHLSRRALVLSSTSENIRSGRVSMKVIKRYESEEKEIKIRSWGDPNNSIVFDISVETLQSQVMLG